MLPAVTATIGHRDMIGAFGHGETTAMSAKYASLPAKGLKMEAGRFFVRDFLEELV